MIGSTLSGRYKIINVLGAGGMGRTYIAQDMLRPGNPKCVVKQLRPASTDTQVLEIARRLFATEAEILEDLGNHDQIPRLLAYFEQEKEFYLVQEFIEGHPLSAELPTGKKWMEPQVIQLLQEILTVLTFIHEQNVIHRDIKPDNIIRRVRDNKLVLIDFGAVKQVRLQQPTIVGQASMTVAIGTPGYMPTEQSSGKPRPSSDIFAVGMVGLQALTGMLPTYLQEDEDGEVVWQPLVGVSDNFAAVLNKMVRHYFKHRYQSAVEVLQALSKLNTPMLVPPVVTSSSTLFRVQHIPDVQSMLPDVTAVLPITSTTPPALPAIAAAAPTAAAASIPVSPLSASIASPSTVFASTTPTLSPTQPFAPDAPTIPSIPPSQASIEVLPANTTTKSQVPQLRKVLAQSAGTQVQETAALPSQFSVALPPPALARHFSISPKWVGVVCFLLVGGTACALVLFKGHFSEILPPFLVPPSPSAPAATPKPTKATPKPASDVTPLDRYIPPAPEPYYSPAPLPAPVPAPAPYNPPISDYSPVPAPAPYNPSVSNDSPVPAPASEQPAASSSPAPAPVPTSEQPAASSSPAPFPSAPSSSSGDAPFIKVPDF